MGYDDTPAGEAEQGRLESARRAGYRDGMAEAGHLVMNRAVEEFKLGERKEVAEILRAVAKMLMLRAGQSDR